MTNADKLRKLLAEGRRLLAAATPRPWEEEVDDGMSVFGDVVTGPDGVWVVDTSPICDSAGHDWDEVQANAALIVWAVNNLSALLDAAEKSGTVVGFWTLISAANGERDTAQAEVKRLEENRNRVVDKRMRWMKKHGYCHTGDHKQDECPGDHGK